MTSQDLCRSFDSEGPRAHYEWAMSVWSPVNPLHVPAIQSNFGDLTSWDLHWSTEGRSCCIVFEQLTISHKSSPR
jgi:hypothetical protein